MYFTPNIDFNLLLILNKHLLSGILHGMTSLGAAIAFIGGSRLLDVYTDFDAVNMDT